MYSLLSPSLARTLPRARSLSSCLPLACAHTHSLSLSHTHTLTHTLSLSHTHTHTHTRIHTNTQTHADDKESQDREWGSNHNAHVSHHPQSTTHLPQEISRPCWQPLKSVILLRVDLRACHAHVHCALCVYICIYIYIYIYIRICIYIYIYIYIYTHTHCSQCTTHHPLEISRPCCQTSCHGESLMYRSHRYRAHMHVCLPMSVTRHSHKCLVWMN